MTYQRASTDWLAACRYGISVHWTAKTTPRYGSPLPFQKAVEAFNLKYFIDSIVDSGADYLIFTSTHAFQMLPAPHPVVDRILPGRTCTRDLINEIADALSLHGIHLILYYNHSCNRGDDPAWEQAVGYHSPAKERFATNILEIVSWMGEHYGPQLKAWWFDSSYSVDPAGPENTISTDLAGFQYPWERLTEAAKIGNPQRLVTYNAGVGKTFLYTNHQDYWAGEMVDLNSPAQSRYLDRDSKLQWHGWTCLDDRAWVHDRENSEFSPPLYSVEQLFNYVSICNQHQAPMCFNVEILQDGTISPSAIYTLKTLGGNLKQRAAENLK